MSAALIMMCIVIIPRKWAIHSLTLSWIPAYFYLTYFHSTAYTNEWISSSLLSLQKQSLKGGFSLGSCCHHDEYYFTSSQLFNNIGIGIIVLTVSWVVFGLAKCIDSCKGNTSSKATGYIWYYLLTLHLLTLTQILYYSVYSLSKYTLNNNIDSINVTVSMFLAFSSLFFIVSLWYLTYVNKFVGTQDDLTSKAATRHTIEKEQVSNKTD